MNKIISLDIAIKRSSDYRPGSLAKQGDNELGSIRLSVRPSISALTAEQFDLGFADFSIELRRVIVSPWCLSVCRIITRIWSIVF